MMALAGWTKMVAMAVVTAMMLKEEGKALTQPDQ